MRARHIVAGVYRAALAGVLALGVDSNISRDDRRIRRGPAPSPVYSFIDYARHVRGGLTFRNKIVPGGECHGSADADASDNAPATVGFFLAAHDVLEILQALGIGNDALRHGLRQLGERREILSPRTYRRDDIASVKRDAMREASRIRRGRNRHG